MENDRLAEKRVLVVDDEADVLDAVEELLSQCRISKAASFEEGKQLLEKERFDLAILDIMGVDGYGLLEIAREKGVTALMLTAHALSPENIVKSYKGGACYYIPKEELVNIEIYINDVLEAIEKGKSTWSSWYSRLAQYCEKKFGSQWKENDPEFWEKLTYH